MTVFAEFEFELGENTGIVYESLLPELDGGHQRTKTQLRIEGEILFLKVESSDFVSMRAAVNGWLRLVKIVDDMCSISGNAVSRCV
jgi:KEOPS complex subunit Pcc1